MDKIINTGFALLIAGVILVGVTAIRDVNDGRVLAAVKMFQPQVQSAKASELSATDIIDAEFGPVSDGYELDASEKCDLITNKSAELVRACNSIEKGN